MSDGDNTKRCVVADCSAPVTSSTAQSAHSDISGLAQYVHTQLELMQQQFQTMSDNVIRRMDEMGEKIDELDKTVADTIAQVQAGEQVPQS